MDDLSDDMEKFRKFLLRICREACFVLAEDRESVRQINLIHTKLENSKTMNAELAQQAIYAGEKIHCTKVEYDRDVRAAIVDQVARCGDVGDAKQERFANAELRRLDQKFS